LLQQLDDRGARLVAAALVEEGVIGGAHGDALDRHEGGGGAGGDDFGEGGELGVFDLMTMSV
jgi:hypothetical protein